MTSLFEAINVQEKRILRLLRRLEDDTPAQRGHRRAMRQELGDRLRGLIRVERENLHPLLLDGDEPRHLIDEWRRDQAEIEAALLELESVDPEAVSFPAVVEYLATMVRRYVREDRRQRLRAAAQEIQGEQAQQIGRTLESRPGA